MCVCFLCNIINQQHKESDKLVLMVTRESSFKDSNLHLIEENGPRDLLGKAGERCELEVLKSAFSSLCDALVWV